MNHPQGYDSRERCRRCSQTAGLEKWAPHLTGQHSRAGSGGMGLGEPAPRARKQER